MRIRLTAAFIAVATGTALAVAGPAQADPGMPNCGPLAIVCNMLPSLPDLDHDIDLTRGQPVGPVEQENMAPADVCVLGCV